MKSTIQMQSIVLIAMAALSLSFCKSKQTAERGGPSVPSVDTTAIIRGINQALDGMGSYSPEDKGYAYKQTAAGNFASWADKNKENIEKALNQVPAGFVLQVTGHTCSIGPRDAMDGKRGNIWYATERARNIYEELKAKGVPSDKMVYKGIADDEPLPDLDTTDQRNRRVSFKIVPAAGM
ncbi:MAG: hypothetical protein HS115_17310 [Spirochaetales bacterium]|nr:hypothetical protein [Spirochaetales bacterium]